MEWMKAWELSSNQNEGEVHLPSKKPKNIKIHQIRERKWLFLGRSLLQGQEEEEKWILSCY